MSEFSFEQTQIKRFNEVLARISYPTFSFIVSASKGALFFQVSCDDKCNVTGAEMRWKGRKWLLSQHMTDGEVVQTAFKAILTALEHEARERFTYRGAPIFDPHYDIEKLVDLRMRPDSLKERS